MLAVHFYRLRNSTTRWSDTPLAAVTDGEIADALTELWSAAGLPWADR